MFRTTSRKATSVVDGTTLLFDLPGFRVVECREDAAGVRHVVVMGLADEQAQSVIKARPVAGFAGA